MGTCTSSAKTAASSAAAMGRAATTTASLGSPTACLILPAAASNFATVASLSSSPTSPISPNWARQTSDFAHVTDFWPTKDGYHEDLDASPAKDMRKVKSCSAVPFLPMLPVSRAKKEDTKEAPELPILSRSKSAPMLPAMAVQSRMDVFRREQDVSKKEALGEYTTQSEPLSPLLPAPRSHNGATSPTTALSANRRRKRRSVTFGEAEMVRYKVDPREYEHEQEQDDDQEKLENKLIAFENQCLNKDE